MCVVDVVQNDRRLIIIVFPPVSFFCFYGPDLGQIFPKIIVVKIDRKSVVSSPFMILYNLS